MKFTVGSLFALLGVLFLCFWTVHSLSTAIYCEHSRGHLQCPRGQILKIVSANYGRRAGPSICPHRLTRNRNCGARSSLYKVRAACQDKPSCRLWASNRVFGDPCRGTYKYLQVGYRCARRPLPRPITRYICEHKRAKISCPWRKRMHILFANYGRTNRYVCRRGPIHTLRCRSKKSNQMIRKSCHGKQACRLFASNRVFGDPCHGTYKYIQVRYRCF